MPNPFLKIYFTNKNRGIFSLIWEPLIERPVSYLIDALFRFEPDSQKLAMVNNTFNVEEFRTLHTSLVNTAF